MLFRSIVPSTKSTLSSLQALDLSNVYLENAFKARDNGIALVLCHDAEATLYQVSSTSKKALTHPKDAEEQALREGVAAAFIDIGNLIEIQGYRDEAQVLYKKAEKLGGNIHEPGRLAQSFRTNSTMDSSNSTLDVLTVAVNPLSRQSMTMNKQQRDIAWVPSHIFANNVRPLIMQFKLPEPDERLNNTPQLACCLSLLQASLSPNDVLEPAVSNWLQAIEKDKDEQERLKMLTMDVIRVYKRDELKDAKAVAEVVCLSPVLEKDEFRSLLSEFHKGVEQAKLLEFHQLEGLAQLIQGADPSYLDADDLIKILELLSTRLGETHQQSEHHLYRLALTVSHVLDAMANTKVKDLDRKNLHVPLATYLDDLKNSNDPYLVYQAAYAYQALLCVPDDEKLWKTALRRTGKVIQGVTGLVSAVNALDLEKFMDGLVNIQQGFKGVSKVFSFIGTSYGEVASLAKNGKAFLDCLKEGFSFERKCPWYSALRGADALIRAGELASFKKLVCEVPCRRDPAFQWGVCQRLGEIASNPMWNPDSRRSAVAFLGEIYQNDEVWGQHVIVKRWILNILMQLTSSSNDGLQLNAKIAETQLIELDADQDAKKRAFYQACRVKEPSSHPLKSALPELGSPSLLDRVQNRPDVEGALRLLKKQRLKERANPVYIALQAKVSVQASDDKAFSLMEKIQDFLKNDQKVFLLLGDSGAGKSTFNRQLECELWQKYNKEDPIPLYINLPSIEKPEHDMIAKALRKAEFTEPQIRELKSHRKFILICDGYDESQQTHNLYMSNRLDQEEWKAQMVISCRIEYLGVDYRDRFQPGERNNHQSVCPLFQEAVITPFLTGQIQDYIKQYVSVHQPLWQIEDYKKALELIPTLKDLMKNPFLMCLSLEVLPRMMDPKHLSGDRVTRVALYDQFIVQWLEREKKRLGEKNLSSQARAAFESLSDDGFTQNGIGFLKKLAMAIYKEQDGQPIVSYARAKDEDSWKAEFFNRDDEKQLLREASPLRRSGNQYRFIHRSLLEYGLTLAVFDPQDWKELAQEQETVTTRRGSMSSTMSFEIYSSAKEETVAVEQEPDLSSPLVWRNFVREPSLLQFLEERVRQEPIFKQQLLAYIEHSRKDKKWRTAAANAITILVRSGVQFINEDFQGIKIPGADLSYGVFESAQLQGADLRKVNFRGAWLRDANLSGTQMAGVQFGELPFLAEDDKVLSCAYSPNGKMFAVGIKSGNVNLYTTSNWEKVRTLSSDDNMVSNGNDMVSNDNDMISSVMFSPTSDQLVSTSNDKSIRLWDVQTGDCQRVLSGHSENVNSVSYSPRGDRVVSTSDDMKIRIWDVRTGNCCRTFTGHTGRVMSAAYSPKGHRIVSGSADNTIRLWDVESGDCCRILEGHSGIIQDIAYSPRGD
ncbi:hypothetical protein BGZ65_000060, partial [Modicella reniformis]